MRRRGGGLELRRCVGARSRRLRSAFRIVEAADQGDPRVCSSARVAGLAAATGRVPPLSELDRGQGRPRNREVRPPPPHSLVPDCMADSGAVPTRAGRPAGARARGARACAVRGDPPVPGRQRPSRSAADHFVDSVRKECSRAIALLEPSTSSSSARSTTRLLGSANQRGDWEAWLGYFFRKACCETAEGAVKRTSASGLDAGMDEGLRSWPPRRARCGRCSGRFMTRSQSDGRRIHHRSTSTRSVGDAGLIVPKKAQRSQGRRWYELGLARQGTHRQASQSRCSVY